MLPFIPSTSHRATSCCMPSKYASLFTWIDLHERIRDCIVWHLANLFFHMFFHNTNNIEYRYNNADFRQISSWFSTIPFWKGSYRIVRLSLLGDRLGIKFKLPMTLQPKSGPHTTRAGFFRKARKGRPLMRSSNWPFMTPQPTAFLAVKLRNPTACLISDFWWFPQQTEPWRHNTEHDKSWTQLNAEWKVKSYASTCCSSGSGTYTENESKEKQGMSRTISPISQFSTHWKPLKEVLEVWVRFDPSKRCGQVTINLSCQENGRMKMKGVLII